MKLLAIDTSNQPLSVAVAEDNKLLAEVTTCVTKNHSVTLMPTIKEVLKAAQLEIKDIDRVVVAQGPGSYTGLRIGVTTAKTLAFTIQKELVGVSSLAILANAYPQTDALLVPLFDARRENVFAAVYKWQKDKLQVILEEQHLSIQELCQKLAKRRERIIFIGIDSNKFSKIFQVELTMKKYSIAPEQFAYPSGFVLTQLGRQMKPVQISDFVPRYLRLTQAETQWLQNNPEGKKYDESYVKKI